MLGSAVIESATGTILVYLLLSLFASALNEWIVRMQDLRASMLQKQLRTLLGPRLARSVDLHPLIQGLYHNGSFPQYLPTSTFALALIQLAYFYIPGVNGYPGKTGVFRRWKATDRSLLEGLRQGATGLGPIQSRIEKWY